MNEMSFFFAEPDDGQSQAAPARRSAGGEVRWVVVAQMPGVAAATIVASRLEVEGIPVRVWQEAAGQALGLLVGALGTGHVAVPDAYAERARLLLQQPPPPMAADE
jgi:hypothetical protein